MEKLTFLLHSLIDRDSYNGFGGIGLMATATMVASFHIIIGVLMAIGGLILLYFNIMIQYKKYEDAMEEDEHDDDHDKKHDKRIHR